MQPENKTLSAKVADLENLHMIIDNLKELIRIELNIIQIKKDLLARKKILKKEKLAFHEQKELNNILNELKEHVTIKEDPIEQTMATLVLPEPFFLEPPKPLLQSKYQHTTTTFYKVHRLKATSTILIQAL